MMALSLLRRKSISRSQSPSPSAGSTCSARSTHSNCEHKLNILDYEMCLSCFDRQRSKSTSGGFMSKIARKLGRMSIKPDIPESSRTPPPSGEEGDREDLVQSGGHTLQVPTPPHMQQKMKSISTSHLERNHNRYYII